MLFAGISLAQTTALTGTVVGEDGKPQKDVVVKITRVDIRGNYPCKTNKKGEYYYGGLPLGTYNISVEVDGRERDSVRGVRTGMGEPKVFNFDLFKIKQRNEALQKAAESGKLTAEQSRELTPEARAALERQAKERQAQMAKDKAVNDAFNAGMQAVEAKQFDVAVESFKKAAEANTIPTNAAVILGRLAESWTSLAATKTGAEHDAAMAQALEAWVKVIAVAPTDPGYHNNYALALARSGKLPEAQEELQKAATLDPQGGGRYYFNLGALLVNSGKNEAASQAFKKAIELTPSYAEAYFQLGNCLMAGATLTPDGKTIPPPGAKEAYEEYLKLAPNGPSAAGAKGMLDFIAAQIQTTYRNPSAPEVKKAKKK
jgi:tetratricopeptide (TPR) repeat protein